MPANNQLRAMLFKGVQPTSYTSRIGSINIAASLETRLVHDEIEYIGTLSVLVNIGTVNIVEDFIHVHEQDSNDIAL